MMAHPAKSVDRNQDRFGTLAADHMWEHLGKSPCRGKSGNRCRSPAIHTLPCLYTMGNTRMSDWANMSPPSLRMLAQRCR